MDVRDWQKLLISDIALMPNLENESSPCYCLTDRANPSLRPGFSAFYPNPKPFFPSPSPCFKKN